LIGSSETVGSNDDLVDEVFDNKFNESDCWLGSVTHLVFIGI
jgi:hypothetical protein